MGIEQLTIYDLSGNERVTIIPNDGSTYAAELMKKEELLLKFVLATPVRFALGDWCKCEFGRFELTSLYRPTLAASGAWQYELPLQAHYWKWTNKILYYDRQHARECSFTLTHDIAHHASIIVSNLAALGYTYEGKAYVVDIQSSVTTELKLVSYENASIIAALGSIAKAFDCEWWVTDNIIHFGRCELGTEVELAEGDEVNGMSATDSSQSYATRIIAFGSKRNLTQAYRPDSDEVVVGSIREKRLMLPKGTPFVDTADNLPTEQAVETVFVYDDIYPHRIGTIASVTTKEYSDTDTDTGTVTKWNAFRFTDAGIKLSNDYKLKNSNEGFKLIFEDGALAGMDFDVNFNPDGLNEKLDDGTWNPEAQVYEIVRNDSYGVKLPNDDLKPAVGDKYSLYNFDISYLSADLGGSDNYIELAEKELLAAAKKDAEKLKVDAKSYTCPINIVRYYGYTEDESGKQTHATADELDFGLGQKIKLVNPAFFKDSRSSRVYGFEKYLDGSKVTYTVSDNSEYSKLQALSENIDTLAYKGYTYTGVGGTVGGTSVYLITTHDSTTPSESNAFSAARAVKQFADKDKALTEFLRKDIDDRAKGRINFESGLESEDIVVRTLATIAKAIVGQTGSENFRDGFMGEGWRIWQNASGESCATLDRLTVRKTWAVLELLIGKVRSVGGQICVSAANGKIKAVAESATNYIITFEAENTFAAHDLMRCQTFSTVEVDGGETAATPRGYWVEVSGVQSKDSVLVPKSEFLGQDTPQPGDECVLMGNTQNADRQDLVLISATEDGQPRVDVMNGVQSKDTAFTGCLRARLGNLGGIVDSHFPVDAQPQGDGLYADNAYLRGTFVLSNGNDVKQLFELMDNKLRSVISDNWTTNNLLVNGWLFNGLAGWTDDNGAAAVAGGKALAMGEGVLTCAGLPIVQGKTAPQWELKTEDGTTYISENDGWEDYTIGTGWVTQPTTPSRLTLRIKVRDLRNGATGDTQDIGYRLLGADADGKPIDEELRSATSDDGDWAEYVITTESTFARFDGLFINTKNPVDIAEVSVAEMRMSSTEIEQTANRIALTVTESNNGKMKKAGVDIDAETITLSAAHTRIVDDEGKTVALFERGKIKTAFLDLGSLNITADDIPMLRELTSAVDREAITGATAEQNITGTAEVTVSAVMNHKAFAVTTADRYIYFTAKAAVTSALGVMGETVEVAYDRHISDELVQQYQGYAESVGGGNWRIKCDKTITDLKLTYKVAVQVTSVGEAERGGTVKLTMGGYQGSGEVALVPTADEGSLLTETVVGANGFASIWESKFVFHLQSTDKTYTDSKGTTFAQPAGCTMMAGDYGWRITAAGIEKTSDRGLNWSKA